jgi:hypothetical protein
MLREILGYCVIPEEVDLNSERCGRLTSTMRVFFKHKRIYAVWEPIHMDNCYDDECMVCVTPVNAVGDIPKENGWMPVFNRNIMFVHTNMSSPLFSLINSRIRMGDLV